MLETERSRFSVAASITAFAITVGFELVPGCRDRFLDLVRANAAASVRDEPECLRFDVLLPSPGGRPDVFLYEVYVSRAAFDDHLASAHFAAFDAATRDMVRHKTVSEFTVEENARPRSSDGR